MMNLLAAILCTFASLLNVGIWTSGATSRPWLNAAIAIGTGLIAALNWLLCYMALSRHDRTEP